MPVAPSAMWRLMCAMLAVATPQLPSCALRPVLTPLQLPSWVHANERGALAVGRIGASARVTGAVYDDARRALLLTNAGRGARAAAPVLALRCGGGGGGGGGDGNGNGDGDGDGGGGRGTKGGAGPPASPAAQVTCESRCA